MTDIGIIAIDVVFAVAVAAAMSCLAYLVYLAVREHRQLRAGVLHTAANYSAAAPSVTSLRPSVARHHVASS